MKKADIERGPQRWSRTFAMADKVCWLEGQGLVLESIDPGVSATLTDFEVHLHMQLRVYRIAVDLLCEASGLGKEEFLAAAQATAAKTPKGRA